MNITVCLDPTESFTGVPTVNLINACGLIPAWIQEAAVIEEQYQPESLWDFVAECYGFPMTEMPEGSTVDADGTYRYPGDPALAPLIKWATDKEFIFMYQYAIMAFVSRETGKIRVTRVD